MDSKRCIETRERNVVELSNDQLSVFDGLMLSDGSITARNKDAVSGFYYGQQCKMKGFLEWAQAFIPFPTRVYGPYVRKDNTCYYSTVSLTRSFYTEQRQRWYPEGKKIVPADIRIDPLSVMAWYLGDGYLGKASGWCNGVYFCTQSFERSEVSGLTARLCLEGIDARVDGAQVAVRLTGIRDFINYIGPCPVPEYSYKWDVAIKSDVSRDRAQSVLKLKAEGRSLREIEEMLHEKRSSIHRTYYGSRWQCLSGKPSNRRHKRGALR